MKVIYSLRKKDNMFYILDQNGEVVNPIGYTSITTSSITNYMIAETTKGSKIVIDENNNTILTNVEEYDDYKLIVDLDQKYFALKKLGKWFVCI